MIVLPESIRIVALTTPVNFRADVDGLMRRVRDVLGEDPFSGSVYCFVNPRRDRVKLLVWDHNGFWVLCKRLERGLFRRFQDAGPRIDLSREELIDLLDRVDANQERIVRNIQRDRA